MSWRKLVFILILLIVIIYLKQQNVKESIQKNIDGIIKIEYMQCNINNNNLIIKLSVINKTYITIQNAFINIKIWSGNNNQEIIIPINQWNILELKKYNKQLPTQIKSVDACVIKVFGSDGTQFNVSYW